MGTDAKTEAYSAARYFVAAIIIRLGWEVGGWIWLKLAA
jgi:hypothetical protein